MNKTKQIRKQIYGKERNLIGKIIICSMMFITLMSAGNILSGTTDSTPPAKITYFLTAFPTARTVTLVWRSVGNDDNTGTARSYDIRYSLSPITDANWNSATQAAGEPNPKPAGCVETFMVLGLSPATKYYFAIKAGDETPIWSPLSNSPSATTPVLTDADPPVMINDIAINKTTAKSVTLTWTAPRDIGPTGLCARYIPYDIRYSLSPITDANWDSAIKAAGEIFPQAPATGAEVPTPEKFTITGLSPATKYYFAIKTADEVPNWSAVSNSPNATTLSNTDIIPPALINDISVSNPTPVSVTLTWTAPGDDGNTGKVSAYEMRYHTLPILTESDWNLATPIVMQKFSIGSAGASQTTMALGLSPNSQYYFAIKTADEVPNWSPLSNSPGIKTPVSVAPPENHLFFHEGAIFPNANLAPVNSPYMISWFAGPGEQPHETVNIFGYKWATKTQHNDLIAKGKLPIPYTYAVRNDPAQSADPEYLDTEEKMYNKYLQIAQDGYYGIDIDEYAVWDYDSRAAESINALRRVKQQYSRPYLIMTAAYYGGGFDQVMADGADVMSLYQAEMYFYRGVRLHDAYMKKYTDWIKYYGLEGKNMGIMGAGAGITSGTAPDVDFWIKYLRAESPQIAGFGVSIFKLYDAPTEERAVYDKVMDDNFFKLSPSVSITAPAGNASVSGTVKITASAVKNPETGNPVVSYRYFIDNKLVKISANPEYFWNTSGYSEGKHILTVHAVADDYLAGVSQVNVMLTSAASGLTAVSCNNLVTLKWRKNNDAYFLRYRIYGGTTDKPTIKIDSTSTDSSDTLKVISGLTHGLTYYFRVTAANNDGSESAFSNQATAIIKTGVAPVIKAKWGDVLICSNLGDSIKSYQWFKGSSAIPEATKQYYVTNKLAGAYMVESTDKNECKKISNTISIKGISSLSVYPNPASVNFTFKLNNASEGRAVVSLINSAGIKVMEFPAENIKNELLKVIPVNNLEAGIYVVQVLLNQKDLYSTKIVIKKQMP